MARILVDDSENLEKAIKQEVTLSIENGIGVESEMFPYFDYSWAEIFFFVYAFVLPGLAELSVLFRIQGEKNKLFKQKLILLLIALPAAVGATFVLCRIATNFVPAFNLLYVFGLAALIFLVYKAVSMSVLVDIERCQEILNRQGRLSMRT